MQFGILGPLRVGGQDGAIQIGAPKQRALLAALLLAYRDDGVSMSRLIDMLWDEDPPPTATKAIQVHVSQLRRALGAGVIVTRPTGYSIGDGDLDLARFERLVQQARGAPTAQASELLHEALALFRGPPLADAPLYGPAHGEADRLAEVRLSALERRIELDLELGRHAELASELEALTHEHPYRERFHAQLMVALYRAGRQADARLARILIETDGERAGAFMRDALVGSQEIGDLNGIVDCLETAAALAADPHTATRLWGAAAALRTEAGASRQPDEVAFAERTETRLRAELGPEAFVLTVREGTDLSQSGAVALALL